MKNTIFSIALAMLVAVPSWAAAASSFDRVIEHYEPIRQALIADSLDSVSEHGAAIAAELRKLENDFTHQRFGAAHESMVVIQDKLSIMIESADVLAASHNIEDVRDAFYVLSKWLVRWQEGVDDPDRPKVAYCPMYKRSWLQPGTEIGNPYGGMPRCGTIVAE